MKTEEGSRFDNYLREHPLKDLFADPIGDPSEEIKQLIKQLNLRGTKQDLKKVEKTRQFWINALPNNLREALLKEVTGRPKAVQIVAAAFLGFEALQAIQEKTPGMVIRSKLDSKESKVKNQVAQLINEYWFKTIPRSDSGTDFIKNKVDETISRSETFFPVSRGHSDSNYQMDN